MCFIDCLIMLDRKKGTTISIWANNATPDHYDLSSSSSHFDAFRKFHAYIVNEFHLRRIQNVCFDMLDYE